MHEVPVVHAAVVGAVLAHGRDDDAVRKGDAAEVERPEQWRSHAAHSIRNKLLHTKVHGALGGAFSGRRPTTKGEDMKIVSLVTLLAAAGIALPASAQTQSTPRVDQRQANQERRIERGEKSGALNEKEAARLEKGQARVQKMEDKAAADGKVTRKERVRLEKAQDRQSRRIYRQKHDKQTAK